MANGNGENATEPEGDLRIPEQIKRGRGRPAGSKSHAKKPEAAATVRNGPDDSLLDASFLADGLCDCAAILEDLYYRALIKRLSAVIPEKVPEFIELAQKTQLNERDRALARRVIIGLSKKYKFLEKLGPEILAVVGLAQYFSRQMIVGRFVQNVEKKMKKAEPAKKEEAPAPPEEKPAEDAKEKS